MEDDVGLSRATRKRGPLLHGRCADFGWGRRYNGTEQVRAYFSQVPPGANWTLTIVDVGRSVAEPWVLGRSTLGRAGTQGMTVDDLAVLRRGADGRLRYHIDMFTAGVRQAMERD